MVQFSLGINTLARTGSSLQDFGYLLKAILIQLFAMPTIEQCFALDPTLAGIQYELKKGVPEDVSDKIGLVAATNVKQDFPSP